MQQVWNRARNHFIILSILCLKMINDIESLLKQYLKNDFMKSLISFIFIVEIKQIWQRKCNIQQTSRKANYKHKRRQNEIHRLTKTHYLYKSYDCTRNDFRMKQSTNVKWRWNKLLNTFTLCLVNSSARINHW